MLGCQQADSEKKSEHKIFRDSGACLADSKIITTNDEKIT